MDIIFKDSKHETVYNDICSRMKYLDCYHRSLAYLLSLDTVLCEHIEGVYDFQEDGIKPEGLNKGFQTGTSKKTTRLAFNLWNNYYDDGETFIDKDGIEESLPSANYSPAYLFCCEYAKYYVEALKIRFPEWF